MELRQLRYFIAIAEEGSFSRAAQSLHISQPSLSTQMKNLEKELEVTLLERSNRGVALTKAGSGFFEQTRVLLARLEHAKGEAKRVDLGNSGVLSIGLVSIAAYGILPPALRLFRSNFPLVDVHLHELTTDVQIREIRASRLDLGIGLAPVNEQGIRFEPVHQEELMLAAPAQHPTVKRGAAVDLRTLAKASFIVPPRDVAPGLYDLTIDCCRAAGFAPRISQHARQMQTVIGLVACGMGFALVPSSVRHLRLSGVKYHPLRGKTSYVEVGILSLQNADSRLRGHFIEALRDASRATRS